MMMIRAFNAREDYADAAKWWIAHGWPVIPSDHLSSLGVMATEGKTKLAVGWLYVTNSAFGWFEFLVANPEVGLKIRVKAIECVIEGIVALGAEHDIKTMFTSVATKQKGLVRLYRKNGWIITDQAMTNLIRKG